MEIEKGKIDGVEIKKAIVEAIAFFDLFSYPLTSFEVWRYLGLKRSLNEVLEILDQMLGQSEEDSSLLNLKRKNGFYFLAGREETIRIRMERYNFSEKKFRRALLVAKIFKFIPWIKMIALGNIIGAHNLREESDIDLFIVCEKGRMWLTRFFAILIIKILGLRPKLGETRDKICLSFFVDEEALGLEALMIKRANTASPQTHAASDIYFIYWLAGLTPIYDQGGIYRKFIEANVWLGHHLPNWQADYLNYRRDASKSFSRFYRDVVDMFLGGLEKRSRKWQLRKMPAVMKDILNRDERVVVGEKVIKLHLNDRRKEYLEKLSLKLNPINLK